MAKVSIVAREKKRALLVEKYRAGRLALKEELRKAYATEKKIPWALSFQLQKKYGRKASPIRKRTRCFVCKRPRAVYRDFGLCRIHLRTLAMNGEIPGIRKASW